MYIKLKATEFDKIAAIGYNQYWLINRNHYWYDVYFSIGTSLEPSHIKIMNKSCVQDCD